MTIKTYVMSYLDVRITIGDDELTTEVYNKVDDFTFPVVMFTFPSGNIPIQLGYDVFLVKSKGMPLFSQRNLGFFMCPTRYSPPFAKEVTPEVVLLLNSRESSREIHLSCINMASSQFNRLRWSS